MKPQDYYLLCAVILVMCLFIVWAMHYQCQQKIERQAYKNRSLQKYVSELGIFKSGVIQLVRQMNWDDLESHLNLVNSEIDKLEADRNCPDPKIEDRRYRCERERWLAVKDALETEFRSRDL